MNADARGYYFTEYEPAAVAALATRTPPLTSAERISLLGDEWRMVRAGRHDIGIYLDLAAAFASRRHAGGAGRPGRRASATCAARLRTPPERAAFDAWIRATFTPALTAVGLESRAGDSDDVLSRRGALLRLLGGVAGDTGAAGAGARAGRRLPGQPASLPPTLVAPVLQVAAAGGDAALYDQYLAQGARVGRHARRVPPLLQRAGRVPAIPRSSQRTLKLALSDDVRSQDVPTADRARCSAGANGDAAWALRAAEWEALAGKVGTFQGIPYIVSALGAFCSADRSAEIAAFFKARPVPAAARALQQALERIDACAAVDVRQSPAFAAWLGQARARG